MLGLECKSDCFTHNYLQMDNKNDARVFSLYTLQMSTFANNKDSVELLDGTVIPIEEIKKRKNEFLRKSLTDKDYKFTKRNSTLPHRIAFSSDDFIVFLIANPKKIKAEKNFQEVYYPNEPSIMVVFRVSDNKQAMVAIEKSSVFSSMEMVSDFIVNALRSILYEFELRPYLREKFDEQQFWTNVQHYSNRIKFIRFDFVKENNEDLYKNISEDLKDLASQTNSHNTVVQLTAETDGVLENINPQNKQLNGMVESASQGTSEIRMKVKGLKGVISTKGKSIKRQIDELELQGNRNDVLFILEMLFKDEK